MTASGRCASCVCAFLALSCGTLRAYEGAPLPPDQVALLAPASGEPVRVLILSVDGHQPGVFDERVEVAAGEHRVEVLLLFRVRGHRFASRRQIRFAARAGAAYRVHGDWFLHGPRVRVTDAAGDLVAEAVTDPRER